MKKIKYWWIQHIPIIGILFVFLFHYNKKWSSTDGLSIGSTFDFFLSGIIQSISVAFVMMRLLIFIL